PKGPFVRSHGRQPETHLYAWFKLVLDTMFLRCPECGGCAYCYDRRQNLPKPRRGNIRFYGRVIVEVDIGVGFEGLVFDLFFLRIHFEGEKTFGTIQIRAGYCAGRRECNIFKMKTGGASIVAVIVVAADGVWCLASGAVGVECFQP